MNHTVHLMLYWYFCLFIKAAFTPVRLYLIEDQNRSIVAVFSCCDSHSHCLFIIRNSRAGLTGLLILYNCVVKKVCKKKSASVPPLASLNPFSQATVFNLPVMGELKHSHLWSYFSITNSIWHVKEALWDITINPNKKKLIC